VAKREISGKREMRAKGTRLKHVKLQIGDYSPGRDNWHSSAQELMCKIRVEMVSSGGAPRWEVW
jgi:hypothetical protein